MQSFKVMEGVTKGTLAGQRTEVVLQQREERPLCRGCLGPSKRTKRITSTFPDTNLSEPWGTGIRSFLIFCYQVVTMVTDLSFSQVMGSVQKYCMVLRYILVSQSTGHLLCFLDHLVTAG